MKTDLFGTWWVRLAFALSLSVAADVQAQTQPIRTAALAETVVTATRTEQPLVDLVADVTVIDRNEIERSGATAVGDVLVRIPGLEMVRNGGPGGTTSLYLRGAETRFTAVFIDGVRVDSQSTGGATWEAIPLPQIDRIEVVRGPASAVYGSDALGGVIQIFTRKGQGPFTPFVGVGVGTYGTRKWEGGFSGSQGGFDYAFSLAREASSGFNVRLLPAPPTKPYNQDDDGYVNESVSGRMGWKLNEAHRLEASVLSSNTDAQYDNSNAAPRSTYDDHSLHLLQTKGLNWRARWSDRYSTLVSLTESRDQYETRPTGLASTYLTMTRLNGYLWQNEWRIGAHQLTATLERRTDYLENGLTINPRTAIVRDRSQDALALGYGWRAQRHSLQLNARHDQDSEFGGKDTGSTAYAYALTPQWRATASLGTAFRAPTLYQRFSIYGLSGLQPESSTNQEVGLRFAQGTSQFDWVVYRNMVTNLITYSSSATGCANGTGCYTSTAQAEYAGMTVSLRQRVADVNLQASLDVQNPRDSATGNQLARRASHHASLSADTRRGRWVLGGQLQLSGDRYDDAANTVVLPGYALASLFASTRIGRDWTALARIDNLTDTPYQLASGYATPGRSLYLALKWMPQ
jgi:vitamin B12 transporter